MTPRIAGIRYLNARPYFFPFTTGILEPPGRIELMTPAQANAELLEGRADCGLISSVVWLRHRDSLARLAGLDIACLGPSGSIFLFSKKPWNAIRSVVVTDESATSVELLRGLIRDEARTVDIVTSVDPLGNLQTSAVYDAALLIGDAALAARPENLEKIDLGSLWHARTGLPMVYAVLARRVDSGSDEVRLRSGFEQALAWSRKHVDRVISGSEWASIPGFDAEEYLERFDSGRGRGDLGAALEAFARLLGIGR